MKYPKYKLAFPNKKVWVFNGNPMTQFNGYTLNTYASGNGIVSASKSKGFWGESAELFQSAANYHSFEGYSANKGTISGNIYIFGKGNDVVTAFFPEMSVYNLYITQTPGGTISAVPMSGHYGEIITLSNTPSAHYTFNGYSVTGATITGNQLTIGNSDISIQANWVEDSKYNLTIQQVSGGRVTSNKSTGYQGDQVTLSNTPSSHYTFGSYSITGATLTGNKFNFGSQNVTAKGSFVEDPIRSVSLSQQTGGRISATPMSGYDGTQVVLTNSVSSDYLFSAYDVTGATLTGNRFTLSGSNATAKGVFKYHPVRNIVLQQSSGGRIFSDKSTGYDGDIVVFTYTPSSNYDFNGFSITGSTLSGNSAMINNGNITAKGNFAIHEDFDSVDICNQTWMKYNLAVDDGLGGVVKKHCASAGYDYGVQYYYTPSAAYRIGSGIRGWRMPTWGDVTALRACAGGTSAGYNLKSTFGWFNDNNLHLPPGNGCDKYGFRALAVGILTNQGSLYYIGTDCVYLCGPSSNEGPGRQWTFEGRSDQMGIVVYSFPYNSIRLIKKPKHTITLNQTSGGVIMANMLTAYSDDIIILTNEALQGWEFSNYSVTGATLTGDRFKMPENDVTAQGLFIEHPTRYLTVQQSTGGTVWGVPSNGNDGDTVTLNQTPSAGYSFSSYSITGATLTSNKFKFNGSNVTAKGNFYITPPTPFREVHSAMNVVGNSNRLYGTSMATPTAIGYNGYSAGNTARQYTNFTGLQNYNAVHIKFRNSAINLNNPYYFGFVGSARAGEKYWSNNRWQIDINPYNAYIIFKNHGLARTTQFERLSANYLPLFTLYNANSSYINTAYGEKIGNTIYAKANNWSNVDNDIKFVLGIKEGGSTNRSYDRTYCVSAYYNDKFVGSAWQGLYAASAYAFYGSFGLWSSTNTAGMYNSVAGTSRLDIANFSASNDAKKWLDFYYKVP